MGPARTASAQTLGATLERDRLERRISRLTIVVGSLRRQAGEHRRAHPRRVRQAIADLESQVALMNARLRDLDQDGAAPKREEMDRLR
jgi:hypothetical protein